MKRLSLILIALALFIGCQTVPEEIPEDLSQAELIQRAQEAADQENWDAALAYYNAMVERYSEDRAAVAIARYEIAFIEYKRDNIDAAETGFQQLIGMYDFESEALPAWPRVLAERLLLEIEDERSPDAAEAAADDATAAE